MVQYKPSPAVQRAVTSFAEKPRAKSRMKRRDELLRKRKKGK